MSYSLEIHPDLVDDITEIASFLNSQSIGLGDDFVIAVDDTLENIENEINKHIFSGRKHSNFFAKTVKGYASSPSYAKNFTSYQIWYELLEEDSMVMVIVTAIIYSRRSIEFIRDLLQSRQ